MAAIHQIDPSVLEYSPASITDAEAAAMFRAAVNLFHLWGITDGQAAILLGQSEHSYHCWKSGVARHIDRDTRARLSNLMGIHKALRMSFREPQRGYDWVRKPNAGFDGRSALDVMLDGDLADLTRVRRYLGGAFAPTCAPVADISSLGA